MNQDKPESTKGVIAWMAQNSVAANLMMGLIFIAGIVGLYKVKQEIFPEFSLGLVTISVPYPGASPAEVEQGIILAVEEAVRAIEGVKRVSSTASEGSAAVTLELQIDADEDRVLADVKSAVDRIRTFPENAEKATVALATTRNQVISLVISGDQNPHTLHGIAEKARADLLSLDNITQVEIEGVRPLEVSIEIPQDKLDAHGLSLQQVATQIRAASVELPGGGVKTDGGEIMVRVADRVRQGHQFSELIIHGTSDGDKLRLGDIASITDGYADTDQSSYFDGNSAVRVTAYRVGDETPTQVSSAVIAYSEQLRTELPENIQLTIWNDYSQRLESRTELLVRNAATGLILVFVVLALLLNFRLAFWVALGIPISFMGAFALMPSMDLSVNMMSLFALIITLGMVVDDAIVVGENIFSQIEAGVPRMQAAINGAKQMAVPVTFSIMTTVVAFSPLMFMPGVMGKIGGIIPIVVSAVLVISLVESFLILPAHLAHSKKGSVQSRGFLATLSRAQQVCSNGLTWFTQRVYTPTLKAVLQNRALTVAISTSLLLLAVALVASGRVPFQFMPKIEGDVVTASVRFPVGTPVKHSEDAKAILESTARAAAADSGGQEIISGIFTKMGESGGARMGHGMGQQSTGSHLVSVEVNLVGSEQRELTSEQFAAKWASEMPDIPGIAALTFSSSSGPSAGSPVDVLLSHEDSATLTAASQELTEQLRQLSDLRDVDNSLSEGKPQLDFHLLPQARTLGLTSNDVAQQLRASFYGAEAIREQRGRNEVKVMVRLPEAQRRSEYDIQELRIRTAAGGTVPVNYVASFERGQAPLSIQRESGERTANIRAELAPGVDSSAAALSQVTGEFVPRLQKKYPGLKFDLAGEQREQKESFASLGKNFVIALFVMFALLAIPFRSYVQPLIIMTAIPFAFVGSVFGHLLLGQTLTIMSLMGVVAASGVVVNDSLVLIDTINKARQEGRSAWQAVVYGGTRRLRPIVLTSATTFLGLMPMILETSVQAQMLVPMAVSLGFGVLFATFVVLLLIPAIYIMVENTRDRIAGLFGAQASIARIRGASTRGQEGR